MMRQTRRGLAVTAVAAGIAIPFAMAAEPADPELLASCAAFTSIQAEMVAANACGGWDDDELERISDRWCDALEAVIETDATSWQGVAARAEVLALALLELVTDLERPTVEEAGGLEHRLAWALSQNIATVAQITERARQ